MIKSREHAAMSNVVSIGFPRRPSLSQRQSALLRSFARHRRSPDDVFWLKENAEVLNILCTGQAKLAPQALAVYEPFYASIEERFRFFPQYYRFLLSICLDLEDLGMPGNKGAALCHWAHQSDLAASELSDLQRAEAERLIARRETITRDTRLDARLHRFICHSETFAVPNKKAAYELTHIAFYLSDYGRQSLALPTAATTSLEFAGLLAYLDQDVDLLSEVCVALRFAGVTPSEIWEDWLAQEIQGFAVSAAPDGPKSDAYHEYLVSSWWAGLAGLEGFRGRSEPGGIEITRRGARRSALRKMSELMFHLGPERSGDWRQMRTRIEDKLEAEQSHILSDAARSSNKFDAFFEEFSRSQRV
jgi:hypothetical protein